MSESISLLLPECPSIIKAKVEDQGLHGPPSLTIPDILLKKCSPVKEQDFPLCSRIADIMFKLMDEYRGAGLAAPQVGLDMRLFVLRTHDKDMVFINPEILELGGRMACMEEGCLSLPGIHINVLRPHKVKFTASQLDGSKMTATYEGWTARVFLHEHDHINGVLITSKVNWPGKTKNEITPPN